MSLLLLLLLLFLIVVVINFIVIIIFYEYYYYFYYYGFYRHYISPRAFPKADFRLVEGQNPYLGFDAEMPKLRFPFLFFPDPLVFVIYPRPQV